MARNSAGLRLIGLNQLRQALGGVLEVAERTRPRWWVGSVVFYSGFHEWGTVRLPPRPYFRPAQRALARRVGGVAAALARDATSGVDMLTLAVSDNEGAYVGRVAFELERLVKQWIRIRGLIDIGNMRASFVAAPTVPELKQASAKNVKNKSTVSDR